MTNTNAPHIHHNENTRVVMGDCVLAMLAIYAMSCYYYGMRPVVLALVSVLACVLTDILGVLIAGKKPNVRDISPVVTGMLLPLMMPASIPFHVVVTACVFAIAVAKQPFGGTGHNVFNPAAAGLAFAVICFPNQIFAYPAVSEALPIFPNGELILANSPAFTMSIGGVPQYEYVEMALGTFPGPMGATNILVIVACLLFLVFRGTVRWETPVAFFATVILYCWLSPRVGMDRVQTVAYELMSGIILFGGVFLLGDPVTTPNRNWSRIAWAAMAGIVVMLFRRYGKLEEGFAFAVLLMNATVWGFDMLFERLFGWIRRRRFEVINSPKIQKKA